MTTGLVLGGGVAGLAAAFGLLDRGHRVELLESRSWLGGRAFSFRDRPTGHLLDNGPHVMLGCYDHMRKLLRRIGTEGEFEVGRALAMTYRQPGGHVSRLRARGLPTSLGMSLALWSLPLGLGGTLRALYGCVSMLRGAPAGWTLADWVTRRRQRGAPEQFLWRPLSRAIMNAEPEEVGADLFLRTLLQAFSGSAERAAMWFPRRPWGEVVGEAAHRQLQTEGVAVTLGANVAGLEVSGQPARVTAIRLADGSRRALPDTGIVVSALPWYALARVLPEPPPWTALRGSPLISIYFEMDSAAGMAAEEALVYLVDGAPFHYLYRTPGHPGHRFALLAGGCWSLDGLTVQEIERIARQQLRRYYPDWDGEAPARVRVAKEARATFLATAGLERPPPGVVDGLPANLVVCGDWTDTGLPSTLEGAALSADLGLQTTGQIGPTEPRLAASFPR